MIEDGEQPSLLRFALYPIVGFAVGIAILVWLPWPVRLVGLLLWTGLVHFWTQNALNREMHRTINRLTDRSENLDILELRTGLMTGVEQLFLNRNSWLTTLAWLLGLVSGAWIGGWQGILTALFGMVVAQTFSNKVTAGRDAPAIDAAFEQMQSALKTRTAFLDVRYEALSSQDKGPDTLPHLHPFHSPRADLWRVPMLKGKTRDHYVGYRKMVNGMHWRDAWKEGRMLLRKVNQGLRKGAEEPVLIESIGQLLVIQHSHEEIVHWPRWLTFLKRSGWTDSDVRSGLFAGTTLVTIVLGMAFGALVPVLLTLSLFYFLLEVDLKGGPLRAFRNSLKGRPGDWRTNCDDMLTRRFHTGVALIAAWPTLVAKLVFQLGTVALALFLARSGHLWAYLLPPVALWMCWLDLKDATTPPYVAVIGRSGATSIKFHRLIRSACYPKRAVSLLDESSFTEAKMPKAPEDAFRVFPQWWANLVWLFAVRHTALASGLIICDLRCGRSEYTDREVRMLRELDLNVLFIGDEAPMVNPDLFVERLRSLNNLFPCDGGPTPNVSISPGPN